jgi:hypothetical protein
MAIARYNGRSSTLDSSSLKGNSLVAGQRQTCASFLGQTFRGCWLRNEANISFPNSRTA